MGGAVLFSQDLVPGGLLTQAWGCVDYKREWYWPEHCGEELRFHAGIDIGVGGRRGVPVLATRPGTVVAIGAGTSKTGLGRWAVCVAYDTGGFGWHGHVINPKVRVGQRVEVWTQLAEVGSDGASSGPHLHYELRSVPAYDNHLEHVLDPHARLLAETIPFTPTLEEDDMATPIKINPGEVFLWPVVKGPDVALGRTRHVQIRALVSDREGKGAKPQLLEIGIDQGDTLGVFDVTLGVPIGQGISGYLDEHMADGEASITLAPPKTNDRPVTVLITN